VTGFLLVAFCPRFSRIGRLCKKRAQRWCFNTEKARFSWFFDQKMPITLTISVALSELAGNYAGSGF